MDWILEPADLSLKKLNKHPGGYRVPRVKMPPYRKYQEKGFGTPSGKMEFSSSILEEAGQDPLPTFIEPGLGPKSKEARQFPLILTTGARLPMYQHSRTFRLDQTRGLQPDPFLDINPVDAVKRKIVEGEWVHLATGRNSLRVRAHVTEIVPPGVINFYHAWPEADANLLIEPDYLDPISGYPGFKSLLCQVKKAQ
jgi:anaerobic selenocysteine-containing dehydrogenase